MKMKLMTQIMIVSALVVIIMGSVALTLGKVQENRQIILENRQIILENGQIILENGQIILENEQIIKELSEEIEITNKLLINFLHGCGIQTSKLQANRFRVRYFHEGSAGELALKKYASKQFEFELRRLKREQRWRER